MQLHFISGLPRAGSTLLAAILRQNPRFHAGIQSPLADIVVGTQRAMSASDSALFIDDDQRARVLAGVFSSFYSHLDLNHAVFDSNRLWCALLPAIATLFTGSRLICCVRNPAWILDSMERVIQANPLRVAKMFNYEVGNVAFRVEAMATKQFLGPSLNALRQAWFSEYADRLIAVRYDSLAAQPKKVVDQLYDALELERFPHDYRKVHYTEADFDDRLGLRGLHEVKGPVEPRKRTTILPPELFSQHDREFWSLPGNNPRQVVVL
jgi:sulfotransferase